ncbi:MAG: hypothetical protein JWN04_2811 [Myxococcaceae bacterium]|nr:hypothetical protein [Myxococcaceae bacterium]
MDVRFLAVLSRALVPYATVLAMCSCTEPSKVAPPSVSEPPLADVRKEAPLEQASLCEVHTLDAAEIDRACKAGQRVAYLPNRWGNEQLPLIFAAGNCDLRFSVVYNSGGVVCLYAPRQISAPSPSQPDAQ